MLPKKSKNANLEDKRAIFLEIGMILALALALTAFNWKTYDRKIIFTDPGRTEDIPVDMVPVTVQKPPEPPRIVPPRVIAVINIVDDEAIIDEDIVIDAEIDPMDTVPLYNPVPAMHDEVASQEEEIFSVVESMPQFPGGEAAMYAFLQNNMAYPRMALEAGISGKVYVTFVVEKDGSITDIKLLRGIGGGCDEEAMRVVKKMPVWTPGSQRSIPVRVQYIMSVKFTLAQM